jgi:hypothetical protein
MAVRTSNISFYSLKKMCPLSLDGSTSSPQVGEGQGEGEESQKEIS